MALYISSTEVNVGGRWCCRRPQNKQIWFIKNVSRSLQSGSIILQKQPSRDALRKMCSKNMLKFYKRTLMPKCNFNKVALQLYWNPTLAWVFSCKFAAYFQNTFLWEKLWRVATDFTRHSQRSILLRLKCSIRTAIKSQG